jgi:hypothetical protein
MAGNALDLSRIAQKSQQGRAAVPDRRAGLDRDGEAAAVVGVVADLVVVPDLSP